MACRSILATSALLLGSFLILGTPEPGAAAPGGNASSSHANPRGNPGSVPRTVFVTSQVYNGNLGGLQGADLKCQTLAMKAGLLATGSVYKAWLSDNTTSPSRRFIKDGGPYVLPDGTVVAKNWGDLVNSTLQHAIDMDENKNTFEVGAVWTGTKPNGAAVPDIAPFAPATCRNWTIGDNRSGGYMGFLTETDTQWSCQRDCKFGDQFLCSENLHLYCIQQ